MSRRAAGWSRGYYDPWEHANALNIEVTVRELPVGQWGETRFGRRQITLTTGLCQDEERSTLAHELVHLERGPFIEALAAKEERWVDQIASERLIPWPALLHAIRWARDIEELADELAVDEAMMRARLDNLTDSQRDELDRAAVNWER